MESENMSIQELAEFLKDLTSQKNKDLTTSWDISFKTLEVIQEQLKNVEEDICKHFSIRQ